MRESLLMLFYGISFFLSIFLPDFFIPGILRRLRERLNIEDEKEEWRYLPKIVGRVERTLYWLFWFLLNSQSIIFIGIWLGLKTAGGYNVWLDNATGGKYGAHKGRAKFLIFLIGNGLSIILVIFVAYITKWFMGGISYQGFVFNLGYLNLLQAVGASLKFVNENAGILAIILSPLVAVVAGEFFRKKNFERQKRLEILDNLMAYRDKPHSEPFLKSLNSLKLFFPKDERLKKLIDDFYSSFLQKDKGEVSEEFVIDIEIKLIKRVCDLEGFRDITGEEIKRVFSIKK